MRHTSGRRLIEWAVSGRMLATSMGIAAALAAPLAATGQTVASTDNTGTSLEEIVVTANKLNAQKVLDIPASIQAISGDAIQAAGISGIMGIAGDVPGLSIQDLGPGDKKYVIRGINSTGDATAGIYY